MSLEVQNVANQFGSNLRYCRNRAKLSPEALAVRASIHRSEVDHLERGGRVCRIDTLVKLAGALEVPPEELLDGLDWEPGRIVTGQFNAG